MNDRSVELYKQALEFAYSSIEREYWDGTAFQGVVAGRFTELIMREMLQTCEDHPAWTGRMIGQQIREHFGVES